MSKIKLISHRGNLSGPNPERENSPEYLMEAINLGVDVEIDVWVLDSKIYLGHDKPEYLVDLDFLSSIKDKAWYHCKNIEALIMFTENKVFFRYFWHQNDDYTITSTGHIWTYPGRQVSKHSIVVDLNEQYSYENGEIYGACVDYLDLR
jgi:hypothetical protein